MGAVVEHDHASVGEPRRRHTGAAEDCRLGSDLRDQRAGGGRGHLTPPGERGATVTWVEQVVGWLAVGCEPATPADAAGCHAGMRQVKGVQGAPVERALYIDWAGELRTSADRQVAGAIDGKAWGLGKHLAEQVGEQPLGKAAAVELQPRWAGDRVGVEVNLELTPAFPRRGARGRSLRRQRAGPGQRDRRGQLAAVAGALDVAEQRGVDQAAGQLASVAHGLSKARHQRAYWHLSPWVAVQQRQLAVRQEAGEALVPAQ